MNSETSSAPLLDIIVTGRNDGYGGEDFAERMFTAAEFNHRALTEAGIPHRFTLVEWNTPAGRPPLAGLLRERLPWWDQCYIVSPAWHEKLSENPRLVFMEFFAKNVGIRRSPADWILTTNSDIFLSREVVAAIASGTLEKGTLYRAMRTDIDRTIDWRRPTWELFENQATWLREHELYPPDFGNAAGDFLLLDREGCHSLGGFNEIVKFAKIYKDGQFCLQSRLHGFAVNVLGRIYHLDHDGSFITATEKYGPKHETAHFGPWWDFNHPYTNRRDWGLTAATPELDEATGDTYLRTPEERGPALSVVFNGELREPATESAVRQLLAAHPSLEVVVASVARGPVTTASATLNDENSRVRSVVAAESSWAAAISEGLAHARGRLLLWAAQPVALAADDVRTLVSLFDDEASVDAVTLGERWVDLDGQPLGQGRSPDSWAPIVIARRSVYETTAEIDTRMAAPLADYWLRITAPPGRTCAATAVSALVVFTPNFGVNTRSDAAAACRWSRAATHDMAAPLGHELWREHQHHSEVLEDLIARRLRSALPAGTTEFAIRGLDRLTPLVVAAASGLGMRVNRIYVEPGEEVGCYAGIPLFTWRDTAPDDGMILTMRAGQQPEPVARVAMFDSSPVPILEVSHTCAGDDLSGVRLLAAQGRTSEALEALSRTVDADEYKPAVVLEMAELAEQAGQLARAVRIYSRLLRRSADEWQRRNESLLSYRLGSLYKRDGHGARALRYLRRALRGTGEPRVHGAAHFHVAELLRERRDIAGALNHYRSAIACIPNHAKSAERIAELQLGAVS
jgi:hypothetical protein